MLTAVWSDSAGILVQYVGDKIPFYYTLLGKGTSAHLHAGRVYLIQNVLSSMLRRLVARGFKYRSKN